MVRQLIREGLVSAVHDISDGGALVAIAEMGLAGGSGVEVTLPNVPNPAAIFFGEDQGRMLVATTDPESVKAAATAAKIFSAPIGRIGGNTLIGPAFTVSLADLRGAHEVFFPKLMGSELTPAF